MTSDALTIATDMTSDALTLATDMTSDAQTLATALFDVNNANLELVCARK